MKKNIFVLGLFLTFISCNKVPISNRKQFNLLPESEMMSMSFSSYKDFISKHQVVSQGDAQLVKNVGYKISKAVEQYFQQKNQSKLLNGYSWEFNLVNDNSVNAWCMPGGKVVFYTGILPVTQNETGIAVVMGHEIAHAIARHGNERMSQQLLVQAGGVALSAALTQKSKETQDVFLTSYGVGSNLGILKYSRTHESEADKLGLVFMAIAGYNPAEAISFWQRMAKQSTGNKPPQLLSTHPSDETRIKDIQSFLPVALKYYKSK